MLFRLDQLQRKDAFTWEKLTAEQQDMAEEVYARYMDATTAEQDRATDRRGGVYRDRTAETSGMIQYMLYQYRASKCDPEEAKRLDAAKERGEADARAAGKEEAAVVKEALDQEGGVLLRQRLQDTEKYPHYYLELDGNQVAKLVKSATLPEGYSVSYIRMGDVEGTLREMGGLALTRDAWAKLALLNPFSEGQFGDGEVTAKMAFDAYTQFARTNASGGGIPGFDKLPDLQKLGWEAVAAQMTENLCTELEEENRAARELLESDEQTVLEREIQAMAVGARSQSEISRTTTGFFRAAHCEASESESLVPDATCGPSGARFGAAL